METSDFHNQAEELFDEIANGRQSPIVCIAMLREALIAAYEKGKKV